MVHRQPNSCRHRMYRLHLLVEQTADITVSWPITDENDLCCNSRRGTLELSRASTWSLNTRNAVLNFSPCACHITSHWIGFVKRWAGSPWDSLGQVQSSGLWFKVLGHRMKNVLFLAVDARYAMMYTSWIARGQHQTCIQHLHNLLLICGVLNAKVVSATSSEAIVVSLSAREINVDGWQSDDSSVFFLSIINNYEPIGFVKTPSAVTHLSWSPESFVRRCLSLLRHYLC